MTKILGILDPLFEDGARPVWFHLSLIVVLIVISVYWSVHVGRPSAAIGWCGAGHAGVHDVLGARTSACEERSDGRMTGDFSRNTPR